ncbi:DNA-directed RNA polymerase subunit delta [Faecalicoccus pleomorphus]|uniref:RNAP delta factor n=1 Tax=Faecalicoccus pleomorphus TaxID=1323 RepID=A0A380LPV9_9FIRM|nr:DNA-directed RNA polymerase subunit delta [Faecalicoccus pleomorphus]MBM6678555.1 DNA-directed RNA polymerase subunit delta [Faecalicoccus pleomorphus]MBM6765373.1 DNA-directed RNA polymerase subunit delta [Faecalicoccus pleomorphus]MBM6807606.1 DNA-directed RNA polymerase subunit delta [Faecalicoccus pleomorphus]MDB7987446.1 DNA-directed RNA polymerase subunit delta [Faecalicoccus pleomorphus]MDB7991582.1 DNA-directed RNA polymerase subunit delta [Faecalicoccus pleomorphus]
MKQSMTDVAYQILQSGKDAMPFIELWTRVSKELGFNESQFDDNIAQFYTDLSIDGRFFNMPQNNWDLRSRHTFSESVMDTDSIAIDEDSDDEDQDETLDLDEEVKDEDQEDED